MQYIKAEEDQIICLFFKALLKTITRLNLNDEAVLTGYTFKTDEDCLPLRKSY